MSLASCVACGHALAIADQRCRHCASDHIGTQRGMAFYVVVALAALVIAILIYNVFLR